MEINIIGGGLAGSEAALQLSKRNIKVNLYEMRPKNNTGAHKTDFLAELVCSNSLGSGDNLIASGLLKEELRILGSCLLEIAEECRVPAGNAFAVDRTLFASKITEIIENDKNINLIREEIKEIPKDGITIIASGPLTSKALSEEIMKLTGEDYLYFFDATAPIIEKNSINFDIAFYASRYGKGEASYINCPMDRGQYEKFYETLINAPKIELKEFEKDSKVFEGCMPVEVMASRGKDTLRFGPLKPVGLVDERTENKNHAVVQLRQDDMAANLYNMVGFQTNLKWGAQKELINSIPGLENAEIVRYGVMHRNTFINSPKLLNPSLNMRTNERIFFAGQLTGTEGYTEAIATGLLVGMNAALVLEGNSPLILEKKSMLGALCAYITCPEHKSFQPINSNYGIIEPLDLPRKQAKDKKYRNSLYFSRSLEYLKEINFFLK